MSLSLLPIFSCFFFFLSPIRNTCQKSRQHVQQDSRHRQSYATSYITHRSPPRTVHLFTHSNFLTCQPSLSEFVNFLLYPPTTCLSKHAYTATSNWLAAMLLHQPRRTACPRPRPQQEDSRISARVMHQCSSMGRSDGRSTLEPILQPRHI